jgi:dethiobiotin synthetase
VSCRGLYVTGTDTDVGKTVVSAALLHMLRRQGRRAVGMKPVASGCWLAADGWRNADALALQAASDPMPDYALVNPFALPDATAPQIAAPKAGVSIALPVLLDAYRQLAAQADVVLVEGVGGWLAPLTEKLDQGALVEAMGLDVVLVVGLRVGCINHARLSERAIRADGHTLVGWIANPVTPALDFATQYFEAVASALAAPCLGRLPYAPHAAPALMADHLDVTF